MSGEIDITPGRELGELERVSAAKLNDLGRPSLRVAELSIGSRELADGVISRSKLDPSVEAQLAIADGAVTTNKIADGAVTTNKIADGQTFDRPIVAADGGAFNYRPSGLIYSNAVPVVYTAIGAWQNMTYVPVPAGLLARDGDAVRCSIWWTVHGACNVNKGRQVYVQGSAGDYILTPYTAATYAWAHYISKVLIIRKGPAFQLGVAWQESRTNVKVNTAAHGPWHMYHDEGQEMRIYLQFYSQCWNDMTFYNSTLEFLPHP